MIHSSTKDNWTRLEYLYSIARQLYDSTKNSEFRDAQNAVGEPLKFCPETQTLVQQESCMVGMIQVWAVVTLESLANHAIAESFNNRTAAIIAIEYPDRVVKDFKGVKGQSELGKKIAILQDDLGKIYRDGGVEERDVSAITMADDLSTIRNTVIHDKPFDYQTDNWEGDIEIKYYGNRIEETPSARYQHLSEFFSNCDKVRESIKANSGHECPLGGRTFQSLIGD